MRLISKFTEIQFELTQTGDCWSFLMQSGIALILEGNKFNFSEEESGDNSSS